MGLLELCLFSFPFISCSPLSPSPVFYVCVSACIHFIFFGFCSHTFYEDKALINSIVCFQLSGQIKFHYRVFYPFSPFSSAAGCYKCMFTDLHKNILLISFLFSYWRNFSRFEKESWNFFQYIIYSCVSFTPS